MAALKSSALTLFIGQGDNGGDDVLKFGDHMLVASVERAALDRRSIEQSTLFSFQLSQKTLKLDGGRFGVSLISAL